MSNSSIINRRRMSVMELIAVGISLVLIGIIAILGWVGFKCMDGISDDLRVILMIIVLSPIVTYMFINMPMPILPQTQSNDWIGFFGSFTGSVLSALVAINILDRTNKQTVEIQKQNKKDNEIRDRLNEQPIIALGKVSSNDRVKIDNKRLFNIEKDTVIPIYLTNIGKGHAKDIVIEYLDEDLKVVKPKVDSKKLKIGFIRVDEYIRMEGLQFNSPKSIQHITIKYSDIYDYEYRTEYDVEINLLNEGIYNSMRFIRTDSKRQCSV
nr:hypothetical protein [uncultured Niameybacter sp.]